jgi:DNA-binding SARP family transcriptional activator
VLLRRTDGTIDVFLREAIEQPPSPWQVTGAGQVWTLPGDAQIETPDGPPPCPALIQLGTTDDGAELYVDLEALGVLAIDASGADLRCIARAVAATLTLAPHAELVRVRTLGFDPYGLAEEERLMVADDIDELLDQVTADTAPITAALERAKVASTFALRAADADENWEPTVALIGSPAVDDNVGARLAGTAGGGGRGLAVLTAATADLPTRWHLRIEAPAGDDGQTVPPRWRLDPLGIPVVPLRLAAEELTDLTDLLAETAAPADPVPASPAAGDEPVLTAVSNGHRVDSAPPPPAPDRPQWTAAGDWSVMIRLIGPVDIVDRNGHSPDRPVPERTLEVLAWLVTHRAGANRLDLETAIWPTGASSGTIMNQLSRARRVLEQLAGPDAHDWIPARKATLTIGPAVISDLDLLRVHLATADHHADQPDLAIPALQAALDLVRGVPARYPWLEAETGSTLTTLPATTAARLAQLHLGRGELTGVQEATARGLAILPAHTELFALRMRAAATVGDRAGVRAEYEAYLRAEQADPLWDGETDRDLQLLYQELARPPRRAAAG